MSFSPDSVTPQARSWLPYVVLLIALACTAVATYFVEHTAHAKDQIRFDNSVRQVRETIVHRMTGNIDLLLGARGLFEVSNFVSREGFAKYVTSLNVPVDHPGIQGVGLSIYFSKDHLAEAIKNVRTKQGIVDFHVWPEGDRPEYTSIVYLVPMDRLNQKAIGFDMLTEPRRRAAMLKARDSGRATATSKIELVQEKGEAQKQAGFLVYVPVYWGGGIPKTLADRRRLLQGFIYSPYRADDLLHEMFRGVEQPDVEIQVFDGEDLIADQLLHRSRHITPLPQDYSPRFSKSEPLDIAGQRWTLLLRTEPAFERASGRNLGWFVAIGGIVMSFLLFGITFLQNKARARAERTNQELIRTQKAVREAIIRYEAAFNQAAVGMAMISLDGHLIEANQRLCDMLGYKHDELIGRSVYEITHPEDVHVTRDVNRILQSQAQAKVVLEKRYLRKDGSSLWAIASISLLHDAAGNPSSLLAVQQDISDRKLAEMQVRERTEAAERANRLKDEFLATLSHELRTPINAVLGWAQLLRTSSMQGAELQRGLDTIERNAHTQAQLIEDLLDVSRIISGKLRLDVRPIDLAPVVANAVDALRPAADAKEIRLDQIVDPSAGPVSGDPDRLQQVIWNLLSNAIKFTPRGGKVHVRVQRSGSQAQIIVSDTGKGIDPSFLPYVFDRFRQADSTTTRKHGGLGIGLAIVRHLIELHGGTVRAESNGENQGATFTVELPITIVQSPERNGNGEPHGAATLSEEMLQSPPSLMGVKVLVVDDDPDARALICALLEKCHADITCVATASEAMDELLKSRPAVIVSDIGMPDEDGYALIRRIRALPPEKGGRTPAAALTAFARNEDRTAALVAGYQTHLAKPVNPAELIAVVANLAGRTLTTPPKATQSGASGGI
ncbi:MAG TPA: CHASE domain-containing protein [Tepidisphaeraceae bacterium]|nr:CHASE domain-containing protein [Tepidisphaeraceae bacterium]